MSSSAPSIAELRAVTQPPSVTGRASAEHWTGLLYMRRLSPYATRWLLRTRLSADLVTGLMIPVGLCAALSLTLPGLAGAALAGLLLQGPQLPRCRGGEIAPRRGGPPPGRAPLPP